MIKNLTPHEITIGELVLPSVGVARVSQVDVPVYEHMGVEFRKAEFGEVIGLPMQIQGVFLVVSFMVRAALPERTDLVSPGGLIRDEEGRVIGASYLMI